MWVISDLRPAALALERATEIIDDHVRSSRGEEECICSAESTAGTGHHDRLAIIS